MDPDEALKKIRKGLEKIHATDDYDDLEPVLQEVVEAMEALDKWITGGGFLPMDWAAGDKL
jgi:hypothetical protein